ncbi:hypothetical protein DFJ73DRAFT_964482 [Zopfochytrium polystomum]|nr:hypothetical protein DFJ73DRAFT_964482 [Zopfochytrium polystomum]
MTPRPKAHLPITARHSPPPPTPFPPERLLSLLLLEGLPTTTTTTTTTVTTTSDRDIPARDSDSFDDNNHNNNSRDNNDHDNVTARHRLTTDRTRRRRRSPTPADPAPPPTRATRRLSTTQSTQSTQPTQSIPLLSLTRDQRTRLRRAARHLVSLLGPHFAGALRPIRRHAVVGSVGKHTALAAAAVDVDVVLYVRTRHPVAGPPAIGGIGGGGEHAATMLLLDAARSALCPMLGGRGGGEVRLCGKRVVRVRYLEEQDSSSNSSSFSFSSSKKAAAERRWAQCRRRHERVFLRHPPSGDTPSGDTVRALSVEVTECSTLWLRRRCAALANRVGCMRLVLLLKAWGALMAVESFPGRKLLLELVAVRAATIVAAESAAAAARRRGCLPDPGEMLRRGFVRCMRMLADWPSLDVVFGADEDVFYELPESARGPPTTTPRVLDPMNCHNNLAENARSVATPCAYDLGMVLAEFAARTLQRMEQDHPWSSSSASSSSSAFWLRSLRTDGYEWPFLTFTSVTCECFLDPGVSSGARSVARYEGEAAEYEAFLEKREVSRSLAQFAHLLVRTNITSARRNRKAFLTEYQFHLRQAVVNMIPVVPESCSSRSFLLKLSIPIDGMTFGANVIFNVAESMCVEARTDVFTAGCLREPASLRKRKDTTPFVSAYRRPKCANHFAPIDVYQSPPSSPVAFAARRLLPPDEHSRLFTLSSLFVKEEEACSGRGRSPFAFYTLASDEGAMALREAWAAAAAEDDGFLVLAL